MKKLYPLILVFLICGCTEEKCLNYELVTESNVEEALRKCKGDSNFYPSMKVLSRSPIGCLTTEELSKARSQENTTTTNVCSGITGTVRVYIVKK